MDRNSPRRKMPISGRRRCPIVLGMISLTFKAPDDLVFSFASFNTLK
jgi:hypothetical protein